MRSDRGTQCCLLWALEGKGKLAARGHGGELGAGQRVHGNRQKAALILQSSVFFEYSFSFNQKTVSGEGTAGLRGG